jgi:hypothetical protein
MIRGADDLMRFAIGAGDGEIGEVQHIYFDDQQ